jgi:biotin operon repressor
MKDRVLRVLQDYQYFYESVKQSNIASEVGISPRHVRECVRQLRADGWAIGDCDNGYFLAFDKEQLTHTINALKASNRTKVDTIFNLEKADKFGVR